MSQTEKNDENINSLLDKLDKNIDTKIIKEFDKDKQEEASKPDATNSGIQKDDYEVSNEILDHMRGNYVKKVEKVDELKKKKKKEKAAVTMTKKRYRQVINALKKSGNALSDSVMNAKKESVRLLGKTKGQTRICTINQELGKLLTTLGREVYDLVVLGGTDILKNKNIAKIIGTINEYNVEKELIIEKFAKKSK